LPQCELGDQLKLAYSGHQRLPIGPDLSGPPALRGTQAISKSAPNFSLGPLGTREPAGLGREVSSPPSARRGAQTHKLRDRSTLQHSPIRGGRALALALLQQTALL